MGRHRESSILDNSNWYIARRRFEALMPIARLEDMAKDGPFSRFDPSKTPLIYDWRASDSMVGWIEYLMIRPCPEAAPLIALAREIAESLDAYPILNEDDYSERQEEAMYGYWESDPLAQRLHWCQEAGASIFAARHAGSIPEAVHNWWRDSQMFD
jgi:hypothetical protein